MLIGPESFSPLRDKLLEEVSGYKFLDLVVSPYLSKDFESGEDAYTWRFDWECNIGVEASPALWRRDLDKPVESAIQAFVDLAGQRFVYRMRAHFPTPWHGCTLGFYAYEGHSSWKLLDRSKFHDHDYFVNFSETISEPSLSPRKIVGVMQVKDSDIFISKTIESCIDLLDELVILNNSSLDETRDILLEEQKNCDKIIVKDILTVNSGGRFLHNLCGTETVAIKIDVDEIWDRQNLSDLRNFLLNENFYYDCLVELEKARLDVVKVETNNSECSGVVRSYRNVYYLGNILKWWQAGERLHGENRFVREHVKEAPRLYRPQCSRPLILHFPFLPMSSKGRSSFIPGWEKNKMVRYIPREGEQIETVDYSGYHITAAVERATKLVPGTRHE